MKNDPLIGRRLANFQIERPLGRGGMAQVYYGQDIKLRRPVAIKVIDARYRNKPAYAERFVREAQTIATWRHKHIIHIYYADDESGLYYYVMEYIDGVTLEELLALYNAKGELLPHSRVLRIGRAIANALDYAHKQGVIHRDVKPTNVLISHDSRVVLADFGLAMDVEMGSVGEVFGSARYIAPEQARNSADAVPQSDIYSLGVILYEMLTGRVPFDDPSPTAVAIQHLTLPPPSPRQLNPKLNEETEAILLKALHKAYQERYQSGSELMGALGKALQQPRQATTGAKGRSTRTTSTELATGRGSTTGQIKVKPEVVDPSAPAPRPFFRRIARLILTVLVVLAVLLLAIYWQRGGSFGEAVSLVQGLVTQTRVAIATNPAPATASPERDDLGASFQGAPTVTASPTPARTPTPTPLAEPQLLADTLKDFSTSAGMWAYLWSPPDQNRWTAMRYESRRYGDCWYGQDYIRLCPDSGHPGNSADVAWRWTSDISGHVQVVISAHKIDQGGDGVSILAYHNDQAVQGLKLEPRDTQGVVEENFFEVELKPGDELMFVIKRNGSAESDHTALRVQLYQMPSDPGLSQDESN